MGAGRGVDCGAQEVARRVGVVGAGERAAPQDAAGREAAGAVQAQRTCGGVAGMDQERVVVAHHRRDRPGVADRRAAPAAALVERDERARRVVADVDDAGTRGEPERRDKVRAPAIGAAAVVVQDADVHAVLLEDDNMVTVDRDRGGLQLADTIRERRVAPPARVELDQRAVGRRDDVDRAAAGVDRQRARARQPAPQLDAAQVRAIEEHDAVVTAVGDQDDVAPALPCEPARRAQFLDAIARPAEARHGAVLPVAGVDKQQPVRPRIGEQHQPSGQGDDARQPVGSGEPRQPRARRTVEAR